MCESDILIDNPWSGDGDKHGCDLRCDKCNQLRLHKQLHFTSKKPNWCRRCRYVNYDEYFGEGGINQLYFKGE